MIQIENISKKYGSLEVLKNISLNIVPGEITTLLGVNGAGKSTLLRVMAGLEQLDEGSVTYLDNEVSQTDFPYVNDIYFVHEKVNYNFKVSINKFIIALSAKTPLWDQEFFNTMAADREIDLDKLFSSLSRGQKMQVLLMIGLASKAKVLLLDEITSVIDPHGRKYFLDLLDKHAKTGNTVVISTNIINELDFYTHNVIILKDTGVMLNEKIKNIPEKFIKIRKKVDDTNTIFEDPRIIWSGVNSDRSISYIISKSDASLIGITDDLIDLRKSNLEDVFIYYFGKNVEA